MRGSYSLYHASAGNAVSIHRGDPMRMLLMVVIFSLILSGPCYAVDETDLLYPKSDIDRAKDKLPENIIDIVESYDIYRGQGISTALEKLRSYFAVTISESVESIWKPIVLVFMVIIICSVLEPLCITQSKTFPLLLFGCIEIIHLTLSDSRTFFMEGIEALNSLYDFSTVLLPCLAGTSVIAGATISAGVKYTAAALFMNILLNASNTILIPLISVYLVFVVGNTVFQQKILSVMAKFIRWGSKTALTASTVIFIAYLNVAGLISSAGDIFAVRITKNALASALPIVGSILSDAASSLVAGAAIVRNSVGIFGMIAVVAILVIPFVELGLRYIVFLAVARMAELFPNQRFSALLDGIAGAYGMLLGVVGSGFIMIFLTLISFMQIVGG